MKIMKVIRYLLYKEEDLDSEDLKRMIEKGKGNRYLVLEADGELHHLGKVYEMKK